MKIEDIPSSKNTGELSQRRMLLCDTNHPIVPHPPPLLWWMSGQLFALTWKGESIMQEAQLAPLATWQTFYILIGTAAATLTGLMFVVVTLLAGIRVPLSSEVFATFNT